MPRRTDFNLAEWPKPCPGACGKQTRPVGRKAAEFPGTVPAVNMDAWCDPCRRRHAGLSVKKGTTGARSPVTDKLVKEREEALIRWREQYEAGRRARLVPVVGYAMDGEQVDDPTRKGRPPADKEPEPGRCKNGHPYNMVDTTGRRRCSTCMSENGVRGAAASAKVRSKPDPEGAPNGRCRRGHPLIIGSSGKRYCRPCRNESKARWRNSKREQGLPAYYGRAATSPSKRAAA